ncbi:MAG: helix-turn-helix domain-containing protein [Pyrinomonadaceae bacterium]
MSSSELKELDAGQASREEFLTTRQLSAILQVSESTVRRLTREGRLPFVRLTSRLIRYHLPAVREALEGTPRGPRRARRNLEALDQEQQQLRFDNS